MKKAFPGGSEFGMKNESGEAYRDVADSFCCIVIQSAQRGNLPEGPKGEIKDEKWRTKVEETTVCNEMIMKRKC
jgi:hypothetical protein